MKNKFVFLAALSGFVFDFFRRIAAHGLASSLDEKAMSWIHTGIQYQTFHTLALLVLGLFQIANNLQNPPACRAKAFNIIGGSWFLGILLFSGSLYALALGASKAFSLGYPNWWYRFLSRLGRSCFLLVAKIVSKRNKLNKNE